MSVSFDNDAASPDKSLLPQELAERRLAAALYASAIARPLKGDQLQPRRSFEWVIDPTHALSPSFPTPWKDPLVLEQISKLAEEKWNIFLWHLNELSGRTSMRRCTARSWTALTGFRQNSWLERLSWLNRESAGRRVDGHARFAD